MKNIFSILSIMIIFSACKKEEIPCDCVTAGTNNNTVKSFSFSVATSGWNYNAGGLWYYDYPSIPESINMNGAVMVYEDFGNGQYISLSYTDNDEQSIFLFDSATRIVEVAVMSASGSSVIGNPGNRNYKIVIIPPGQKRSDINYDNYLQVKNIYQL